MNNGLGRNEPQFIKISDYREIDSAEFILIGETTARYIDSLIVSVVGASELALYDYDDKKFIFKESSIESEKVSSHFSIGLIRHQEDIIELWARGSGTIYSAHIIGG